MAGSEAVLPAYVVGTMLAGNVGKDHVLVGWLRTLSFGLLTHFFIRVRPFISVPALVGRPLVFIGLLFAKTASKLVGLFPTIRAFRYVGNEGVYFTLLMSTGLTFGTIAALFGLSHGAIDQAQYRFLFATVIGGAAVPTVIANATFLPEHLIPDSTAEREETAVERPAAARAAR